MADGRREAFDQAGVRAYLQAVGGNGVLFEDARRTHADHVDGWLDYGGRIDVRAVVGVGLLTTRRVSVAPDPDEGDADVELTLADGDITVPAHSAWQGKVGGAPMGDPIHLQERCSIEHMDQTTDTVVQHAYTQFLLFGRTPRRLPAPECELSGDIIEFSEDVPIPPPVTTELAADDAPATLGQAQWEGKADVIDLPGAAQVVTNDARPVALKVAADGLTMTVTAVDGTGRGRRVTYGPLTGELVVEPGATDVPSVTVDGSPVAPTHDTGGGRVKLSRTGVARIAVRLHGGTAAGTLTLRAKRGLRTVEIASARVMLPAGRTVRARVKVAKAARRAVRRRALRAVATLSVPGAVPARAVVRLRR